MSCVCAHACTARAATAVSFGCQLSLLGHLASPVAANADVATTACCGLCEPSNGQLSAFSLAASTCMHQSSGNNTSPAAVCCLLQLLRAQ
jgi:hypothetical protein